MSLDGKFGKKVRGGEFSRLLSTQYRMSLRLYIASIWSVDDWFCWFAQFYALCWLDLIETLRNTLVGDKLGSDYPIPRLAVDIFFFHRDYSRIILSSDDTISEKEYTKGFSIWKKSIHASVFIRNDRYEVMVALSSPQVSPLLWIPTQGNVS